jgi:hypothetical protein
MHSELLDLNSLIILEPNLYIGCLIIPLFLIICYKFTRYYQIQAVVILIIFSNYRESQWDRTCLKLWELPSLSEAITTKVAWFMIIILITL